MEALSSCSEAEFDEGISGFDGEKRIGTYEECKRHARRIIGVIDAMTISERRDPRIIDARRVERIAHGSGVSRAEIVAWLRLVTVACKGSYDPPPSYGLRVDLRDASGNRCSGSDENGQLL
jgi:hypothetical protein